MDFRNKTAVITGASRGIGRAVALALSKGGARLALVGRDERELNETKRLAADPSRVHVFLCDLRDTQGISALAASLGEKLEPVDILANIAGVWHDEQHKYHGPIVPETPASQIDEVIEVGLTGSFHLTRLLLPGMVRRRAGKVLFLSCGFAGPHEAVGWVHYYVTNKAIEALTAGLSEELRQFQIQVNCLAPWFVATEAVCRFYPEESRRALDPADVAAAALFLLSPAADHISGQVIQIRSKDDFQSGAERRG